MVFQSAGLFSYIAFDHDSGAILSYGSNAISALDQADRADPTASIQIIFVGDIGQSIWTERMGLDLARDTIATRSPHGPAVI